MSSIDSPELVRRQLDKILASPRFVKTRRSAAFLRHLVEKYLEGRTGELKEYSLGIEVFERDASFDPRIDSLVRVEATRLRSRLRAYYEAEGASDPVIIDLPAGAYVPAVTARPAVTAAGARRAGWLLASGVVIAAVCAAMLFWSRTRQPQPALVLRRVTASAGLTAYPALSPDGKFVVYSSDRGDHPNLNLWMQKVEGGEPVRLTEGQFDDLAPAVSPDGKWIAFESEREAGGIFVVSSAGGPPRRVADFGHAPRISPDGRWILYWIADPQTGFGKLWIVPAFEEIEPDRVASEFEDAHNPVFSPDGQRVLFCGTRRSRGGPKEEHDLWIAPFKGAGAEKTEAFAALNANHLDPHGAILPGTPFQWTSEGILISAGAIDNRNLWRLTLNRQGKALAISRVTSGAALDLHPSVRGRVVVFSNARANLDIWSLPVEADAARPTGALERITQNPADELFPSISADGRWLAFLTNRGKQIGARRRDLATGEESEMEAPPGVPNYLKLTADGRIAYFRVFEGALLGVGDRQDTARLPGLRDPDPLHSGWQPDPL